MHIDPVLASVDQEITIPEGWMQGRACFGGLVAALLYRRLESAIQDRAPRALTISFVGPVVAGEAQLQMEVFREGKSVTQAECRLLQQGQVAAVMLASFGRARESSIAVPGPAMPAITAPDQATALPEVPGLTPEFVRHFDFRWSEGPLPYTAGEQGIIAGWVRFREPAGHSVAHLLALVDAWPPAIIGLFSRPAPSSSLTWTIELIQDVTPAESVTNPWWGYRADTDYAADGYAHTRATLWDAQGRPVAISRQTVAAFG